MPQKAKPSRKSPEQKALEAEVKRELRRVQRLEKSLLKRGYTLPSTFVPPLPKAITPATLRKYQRLTPEQAYKKAVYVSPEGVAIKGYVRRKQERVEAAQKAAQTRAENVIIRNAAENLRMLEYFVSQTYDKSSWSEELKNLKNEDRGILQDALNQAIAEAGREAVARRLEEHAEEINRIVQDVLYNESGNPYREETQPGINRRIQKVKSLLVGRPLTVQESWALTEEGEETYVE